MPTSFPKPWRVREQDYCFVVEDATGFALSYTYFETRPPHQQLGEQRMSKAHARAIAARIAKIGA
jgi:hypothetical protein